MARPAANAFSDDPFFAWLQSAAGHRLLAAERAPLHRIVRSFHGDTVLWVGATPTLLDTTTRCMVRERIYVSWHGTDVDSTQSVAARNDLDSGFKIVRAQPAQLPLASASVDGVVLHHVLETIHDQRSALREAERVLKPGGRLLLLAINPLSLWLLAKPLPAFRHVRPLSVPRLSDWLALLGLERDAKTLYLNYRSVLPVAMESATWQRLSDWLNQRQLPVGGVYLITATKVRHGFIAEQQRLREWPANTLPGTVAPVAGALNDASNVLPWHKRSASASCRRRLHG